MTTPAPSKAKAWWALVIPAIGSLVPMLLQLAGAIPAPWGPALTGILMVFAAVTGVVVHQAPYLPPDGVIVTPPPPAPPSSGGYDKPWG